MRKLNLGFCFWTCIYFTFIQINPIFGQSTNHTFKKGSYVIDMGVTPQTINNSLKPYGLVYAIIKQTKTPVNWVIKNNKTSLTDVDFVHNSKSYKGGPFVIAKEFRNKEVDSIITSWKTLYSGLTVDTLITDAVLPVYKTQSFVPVWTLDVKNGAIAQVYLTNAGIPSTAYNWQDPQLLNCCNDLFVMPHADPTWATHSNLLQWNDDTASGGCEGWIWAACHAVSALENMFNTSNPGEQTNFLSEKTGNATGGGPYAPSNSLILWGSHGGGTTPYQYNSYYSRPEMQFLDDITPATENGSEQIYIAKSKWRTSTYVAIDDPDHPDIPGGTSSKAAKLAFGRGFGDDKNGKVMYEAGHSHAKSTLPSNFAAQRAFLNFSFEAPEAKSPNITTNVPSIMVGGAEYQLTSTVIGKTGPYQYTWSAACAGTFNNPFIQNPIFTPTTVGSNSNCAISLTVTDACGRVVFKSTATIITSQPQPPVAVKDSAYCLPWSTVTIDAKLNDYDPEGSLLIYTAVSSTTTSKGVFTINSNGTVTYDPNNGFTNGLDTLTYRVCDTTNLCTNAIVIIRVSYPDSDGDGITDDVDIDDDNDGITDVTEGGGTYDPSGDADSDGIPNYADSSPGGGITWTDANNDGINDFFDKDKDGIPNHLDIDSDNDGIPDAIEANGGNTPTNYNATTGTISGTVGSNGMPDAAETSAGSGVSVYSNPDTDGDGKNDYLDIDSDGDGLPDAIEANGGVTPSGYNNVTGTINSATSSNGWPNSVDPSAGGTALAITNSDADALKDYRDIDSDNDGIVDNIEAQSSGGYRPKTGLDTDGDGWDNAYDADNGGTSFSVYNYDGTDLPDYRDTDSDNDGIPDIVEGHDNNKNGTADWDINGNGIIDASENGGSATKDTDGDGLLDLWDPTYISCSYSSIQGQGTGTTGNGGCAAIQNTDGTDDRDWRDIDDDNDGILTKDEKFDLIGTNSTSPNSIKDYLENPCSIGNVPSLVSDTLYVNSVVRARINNSVPGNADNILDAPDETHIGDFKVSTTQATPDTVIIDFATTMASATIRIFSELWDANGDLRVDRSSNLTTWITDTTFLTAPSSTTFTWNGVSIASTFLVSFNSKGSFRYLRFLQTGTNGERIRLDAVAAIRNYIDCIIAVDAVKDSANTYQNSPKIIAIQENDINNSGTVPLYISISSQPKNGSVVLNPDGTVTYTPAVNYVGLDSLYYVVCSGAGNCDTALVVIKVNAGPCGPGKTASVSQYFGHAYANISTTSVDNPTFIFGLPDNQGAKLNNATDNFIVDLGSVAAQGSEIVLFYLGDNTGAQFYIQSSISSTINTSTGFDKQSFTSGLKNIWQQKTYLVNTVGGIRYLKLTRVTNNNYFDAIQYDSIGIICTNVKPEAINDTTTTPFNTAKVGNILGNDYDPLGDAVTASTTPVTNPTRGNVTISANGAYTYTPNNGYTGTDSFRYRMCDTASFGPASLCDTAWVYITITHNPPNANNDSAAVEGGYAVMLNLFANDTEPENQPLALTIPSNTSKGGQIVVGVNGQITYTASQSFSGRDTVIYFVCDGQTPNKCDTAIAIFIVSPYVNDPPLANRDSTLTEKNKSVTLNVLANDTDPENQPLDVTTAGTNGANGVSVAGGTITVNFDNTISYIPPLNFTGRDSFLYIISDGQGNFDTTTVVIVVQAEINDPPIANNDYMVAYWNPAGPSGVTTYVNPFKNDYDTDGTLDSSVYSNPANLSGVQVVTNATKGNVSWNPSTGQFSYTPSSSQPDGTKDSFYYKVCDTGTPLPAKCDSAWVYVTIFYDNDAPIATRDDETTYVNQKVYVVVAENDMDPENSPKLSRSITDNANYGSAVFTANGLLEYTPNPGYVGKDTIIYQLCDDGGTIQKCDTALVVITVLNNAVVANFDTKTTLFNTATTINIRNNDFDPDGHLFLITDLAPTSSFTAGDTTSSATSRGGTISKNSNGTPNDPTDDYINYTPPNNYTGNDTFWYQVCDIIPAPNKGCATTYAIITIDANSPPVALDDYDTTAVNVAKVIDVLANDYDLTGSLVASTVSLMSYDLPNNGTYSINSTNGKITYTPNNNFSGNDTFQYRVCDNATPSKCDTATVIVTVHAPVPVELIYFDARKVGNYGLLTWATASELNNNYFEIQKSADLLNWKVIGTVKGNESTQIISYYNFKDQQLLPLINYYRLRQVDFDGKYEYSPVRLIQNNLGSGVVTVYPNPANAFIEINFNSSCFEKILTATLVNSLGVTVKTIEFNTEEFPVKIDISTYTEGIYYLILDDKCQVHYRKIQILR